MPLLEVENLSVTFPSRGPSRNPSSGGVLHAVDGISMTLDKGEVLGIVGESGSGKSVGMLAVMGLVPFPGRVTADKLLFEGRDLMSLSDKERRALITATAEVNGVGRLDAIMSCVANSELLL